MKIDPDANAADLIRRWKAGERNLVIDVLANDHPGLTAFVLVQGSQDRTLSLSDCNTIANGLIDHRKAMVDRGELS